MRCDGVLIGGWLLLAAAAPAAAAPSHAWLATGGLVLAATAALVCALLLAGLLTLRRSRDGFAAENAKLRAANAALEKALAVKAEFLATTSHEIRTPLNGILGMTQVLLADPELDDPLRERIAIVHGAGETMKALVDDILDLAKIESGSLAIQRVPLDLRGLLEEAALLWRGQAEAKGLRLELDLAGCPGTIAGDPVRLRQILFNLISNALKFTDRGMVAVSAAAEPREGGEVVVLRVRDSGIGIAADRRGLIFERFRQADGSIARRFGGTGLGLAICRSLVAAMDGTIALESRLGEGSTFTVTLPLERLPDAAPAGGTLAEAAVSLADARLLIVEQNPLTRRILGNMIERSVGAVEAVASAREAAERLASGGIDHVVADAACAGGEAAPAAALQPLAEQAKAAGAHMTLLFAPACAAEAAALAAARPEVQPIAKPIGAPALLAELRLCYQPGGATVDPAFATASAA